MPGKGNGAGGKTVCRDYYQAARQLDAGRRGASYCRLYEVPAQAYFPEYRAVRSLTD